MRERRDRLRFALETGQRFGIGGDGPREDLDRHVPIQLLVARAVDLAHSAFAKFRDDFIGSESRAYFHRDSLAPARLRSAPLRTELWRGPRRSSRCSLTRAEAGPPAPRGASISYVPRRVPAEIVIGTRATRQIVRGNAS